MSIGKIVCCIILPWTAAYQKAEYKQKSGVAHVLKDGISTKKAKHKGKQLMKLIMTISDQNAISESLSQLHML